MTALLTQNPSQFADGWFVSYLSSALLCTLDGVLLTQKLRSPLLNVQSCQMFCLAFCVLPADRNYTLLWLCLLGSFNFSFPPALFKHEVSCIHEQGTRPLLLIWLILFFPRYYLPIFSWLSRYQVIPEFLTWWQCHLLTIVSIPLSLLALWLCGSALTLTGYTSTNIPGWSF